MGTRLLRPEELCLHVIDVQQSLMAKIHLADKVSETVQLMIECARVLNVPILANTQYRKGLGPYVGPVEKLLPEDQQIDKVEFNAVANTDTAGYLDRLSADVTTIALVGVETHICIYQTAMGYLERGLKVWVVSDGVSSRNVEDHLVGLDVLRSRGADVGPSEMLIYELLRQAGTPEFKKVLPYIVGRGA